ncbi:hydroxypyruvate isomerase family protein [Kribbella deserti]|uniref:Hydroxypyruvate isomerase family protein n=1 Tax=Kribbella deserti TaxID=1926257 RepID=A0ABV6QHJ6_9ACTN
MAYELSVCVEMLFREHGEPMSEPQLKAVRAAGISMVEFWAWHGKDLDTIERRTGELGLRVMSMVSEPTGHLVDPGTHDEFVRGVRESVQVARRLGVPNLVVLSGNERPGVPAADQASAIVAGLRAAAPIAETAGVTLVLEPLNTRVDHVGNFLDKTPLALEILTEVDSPNVKLLYDLYHSVVMDEEPAKVLAGAAHLIGHVQIADHPGRHEPGSGDVDWQHQLLSLSTLGYEGPIGLEYSPSGPDSVASLARIRQATSGAG